MPKLFIRVILSFLKRFHHRSVPKPSKTIFDALHRTVVDNF